MHNRKFILMISTLLLVGGSVEAPVTVSEAWIMKHYASYAAVIMPMFGLCGRLTTAMASCAARKNKRNAW